MLIKSDTSLMPAVSLADLAEIAFRRRWSIVLIVLASVIGTMAYVVLIRGDAYVAEARLLVRLGQEQAPAPTTIADRGMMIGSQGYGSGELALLSSRDLISKLVDKIDLTEKPRPPADTWFAQIKEQARSAWIGLHDALDNFLILAGFKPALTQRELAIEALARALVVESPPNSNVVVARVTWPQRGAPELVLRNLLDLYFAHRGAIYQGATAATFFRERRRESAAHLLEAEAALSRFEREHGISSPDDQRSALLKRLAEAETGLDTAKVDVDQAEMALRQLNEARSGDLELKLFAVSNFGTVLQQGLAGQLSSTAAKWLSALTTFGAQDPNVRQLRTELTAISNMLVQQLQAAVAQRREVFKLRETLRDNIRHELQSLQSALGKWQELKRAISSSAKAYELYDSKLNEAQGIAALEQAQIGNVIVVQRPAEQALPAGVRKSTMLLLSVAGGLLLAAVWVTIREFFDHRLHGPGDVETHLRLHNLGTVPYDRGAGSAPRNATLDAYARIAASIAKERSSAVGKAIVVTGADTSEGVTTVTAQIGSQLVALLGLRVLLIDLSRTEPNLTRAAASLAIPPKRAVIDALGSNLTCSGVATGWGIVTFERDRPHILPYAVLLNSVLNAARHLFDVVLIDAPPATDADTLLAARASGHVLLVCASDRLPYGTINQVAHDLAGNGAEMMGCVLNRHRRRLPRWLETILR